MPKILKIEPHLSSEEIREKLSIIEKPWLHKRWMIIYTALLEPRSCTVIAREFGISAKTARQTINNYNKQGVAGVETEGRGGRRNSHLSLEEEKEFVDSFRKKAAKGCFATVREINKAFEKKVGHSIGKKTIYPLLHRHGWRKLMPRPYHPKSDSKSKDAFKKNSYRPLKQSQKKKIMKTSQYL